MNRFIKTEEGIWLNLSMVEMMYVDLVKVENGDFYFQPHCKMVGSDCKHPIGEKFKTLEEARRDLGLIALGIDL